MLTGRAKAYSSSSSVVTHRSTNRARRRVTSFQPKRITNYATINARTVAPPCEWYRLVQPDIEKIYHKTPYFGVQGHPKSLNLAPIDSQCTISY